MEEGRQALDGWRTAGPTSFGAALGPAAPEATPGGLILRGRVNAGGEGVPSPRRSVDIGLRAATRNRIRSGGEERRRFLAADARRNVHPSVLLIWRSPYSWPRVGVPEPSTSPASSSESPGSLRVMDFFWMCPTYAGLTPKTSGVVERLRWPTMTRKVSFASVCSGPS